MFRVRTIDYRWRRRRATSFIRLAWEIVLLFQSFKKRFSRKLDASQPITILCIEYKYENMLSLEERLCERSGDCTVRTVGIWTQKFRLKLHCSLLRHLPRHFEHRMQKYREWNEMWFLPTFRHALRRLRVGGAAVYSTCSLSPVQNDSVVHMTLQSFKQMKFVVTDLTDTFAPFKAQKLFRLYDKCRYGQLVLPYLPNNFGPMYICRIERLQ